MPEFKVKHQSKDERTRELCRRLQRTTDSWEKHDIQEELLRIHAGLIHKIANQYGSDTHSNEDYDDALGEISMSIIRLFQEYDADGPTVFSTYAFPSLIGIMKNWKRQNLLIAIPTNADRQWVQANRGEDTFINPKTGNEEEVAPTIIAMVAGVEFIDNYDTEAVRDYYDGYAELFDSLAFEEALELLADDEATSLRMHYVEELSYASIAEELGCSHRFISHTITKAKDKLREYYEQLT